MRLFRYVFLAVAPFLVAAVCVTPAVAAEPAPGPAAACEGCHGPSGDRPTSPDTPRLAGQAYDYLVQALSQYRSGGRSNPIMGAMAAPLSDAQIAALSRYFSSRPGLVSKY